VEVEVLDDELVEVCSWVSPVTSSSTIKQVS
jgi:hypothetical protein